MQNLNEMKGAIFDLDGVLVDTAWYHFLAWKRLSDELGISFTEKDNERLKGVSRIHSLEILLELGSICASKEEKEAWAGMKNKWYVESLHSLESSALLPGTVEYLEQLKTSGILIALGSASKNAFFILERLGIYAYFDAVIDGNSVIKAKPDPEVFTKGAAKLKLEAEYCAVFEDSYAGIQAAKSAGMFAVGIGSRSNLPNADMYVNNLSELVMSQINN